MPPESVIDVTVVVPCYNERPYIRAFLDNLRAVVSASGLSVEVLIADGDSDDGTAECLAMANEVSTGQFKVFRNPDRFQAAGLNMLIGRARGAFVARMDVHASYPDTYLRTLVSFMKDHPDVGCCGPYIDTVPGAPHAIAAGIALALSSPFGVGGSEFRTRSNEVREVTTAPFGVFRKSILADLGGYDVRLPRSEDEELCGRILRAGHKIFLVPGVTTRYHARETLSKLARMMYQYGFFKPLAGTSARTIFSLRQFVPATFVCAVAVVALLGFAASAWRPLLVLAAAYLSFVALGSARALTRISAKPALTRFRCAASFAASLPVMHVAYGAGFIVGSVSLATLGSRKRVPGASR